ncbi:hypothetical protein [Sediminitomix flava]|uniref:Calx-beta domain-containing protein n=1 Tax=Sediminitomix flava TaxID=379075 RepID=A0A315Z5S7_SEDFL|nr:hypothetical protein [Sediminitomix flava]PWJ39207.1 hypothetical protein BC781_106108 [Sediminitomix flava]
MMKKYIKSLFFGATMALGLAACEEHTDVIYSGDAYVSLTETSFTITESVDGTAGQIQIPVRLTSTDASGSVSVTYAITGADGWESRLKDVTGGTVTLGSGEYLGTIQLEAIDNDLIDENISVTVSLTGATGATVGLGTADSYSSASVMLMNDDFPEYESCISVSDLYLNQVVTLDYLDFYDADAYSGTDENGLALEPTSLECDRIRFTGDAVALFVGSFEMIFNEENGTVSIPKQLYGTRDSNGDDYWIMSSSDGTYNPTTGEIDVDIYWNGYAGGTDISEVDLEDSFYDGKLTISLGAFKACTSLGEMLIGSSLTLDYLDFFDADAYSGTDTDGSAAEPVSLACDRVQITGDAVYLFVGSFELVIDEENGTVSIPKQLYGTRESNGDDYWIMSSSNGTYDPATGKVEIDIYWNGYDPGTEIADVDLETTYYDGKLTITINE